jgi:hypothetical protein
MSQDVIRRRGLRALDVMVAIVTVALLGVGLNHNLRSGAEPFPCKAIGENHTVNLKDDKFSSERLKVKQCDTITIVNLDNAFYKIAFGVHDQHVDYPGYTPFVISQNDSIKIDAIETGTFLLHDHLRDHAKTELVIKSPVSD